MWVAAYNEVSTPPERIPGSLVDLCEIHRTTQVLSNKGLNGFEGMHRADGIYRGAHKNLCLVAVSVVEGFLQSREPKADHQARELLLERGLQRCPRPRSIQSTPSRVIKSKASCGNPSDSAGLRPAGTRPKQSLGSEFN